MKKSTLVLSGFIFIISLFGFNINSLNAASNTVVEITTASSSLSTYVDATPIIKDKIRTLAQGGGGTLFIHPGKYMVKETIQIPSNITIECVGSGEVGPCIIALGSSQNLNGNNMALFTITPGAQNVKIQDLELRSMTPGWQVYPRYDLDRIKNEKTSAVRMGDKKTATPTKNIQFENVRIVNFTYGINAGPTSGSSDPKIENIRIRNISSAVNYIGLRVNSLNASGWDVQNFNMVEMGENQNGVQFDRTGKMAFLQLSCASTGHNANNCIKIGKRSGSLYFREAHVEGPREGFQITQASDKPIYIENSAIGGVVKEKSVLYRFSNRTWLSNPNDITFTGRGTSSTLYSCANVLTNGQAPQTVTELYYPGLINQPQGCNFDVTKVNNSFATGASTFNLSNWITSSTNPATRAFNVKTFGAKGDGVADDTQAIKTALTNVPNTWSRSMLFFPAGRYKVSDTIKLDMGTILQGEPGTIIEFTATNRPLFQVRVMNADPILKRSIHIKNMALRSTRTHPESQNTTAIEFSGNNGASTDHSFNQLEISGFTRGIYVRNDSGLFDLYQPMIDSVAVRDLKLVNNYRGVEIRSQNASNWNFENVDVARMQPGQVGVVINGPGHVAFRGLNCEGEFGVTGSGGSGDRRAEACLSLVRHSGVHIEGLKAKNVKYALYAPWEVGWTPFPTVIRNSDLTEGVYAAGTLFMLSVSNTYATPAYASASGVTQPGSRSTYFGDYYSDNPNNAFPGKESRITSCGDRFINPNSQQAGPLQFVGLRLAPELCTSGTVTPPPVSSGYLFINPKTGKIKTGETIEFQAIYQPQFSCPTANSSVACTQAMQPSYPVKAVWTSSDVKVATVEYKDSCPAGSQCLISQSDYKTVIVTGVGAGTTTITASYKDASATTSASISASAKVTVTSTGKTIIIPSASQQVLGAEAFNFTQKLRKGSSGVEVMELQKFLNSVLGASGVNYNLTTDGKFGAMTEAALIKFQAVNGLSTDGVVGPLTRAVLNK